MSVGIEHRELAGADAADDDIFREAGAQAVGEGADQLVTLAVADRIVDVLETVDIDVDEEDRLAAPDRRHGRLGDLADHGDTRIEARQLVDLRLGEDIVDRFVDAGEK